MNERDLSRVERLVDAADANKLDHVTVFATIMAVRCEATMEARQRTADHLEREAAVYLVRGRRDIAEALAAVAARLTLDKERPSVAELADA